MNIIFIILASISFYRWTNSSYAGVFMSSILTLINNWVMYKINEKINERINELIKEEWIWRNFSC